MGRPADGGDGLEPGLAQFRALCAELLPAHAAAPRRRPDPASAAAAGGAAGAGDGGCGEAALTLGGFLAILRRAGVVRGPPADGGGGGGDGEGAEGGGGSYRMDRKVGRIGEAEACAVFAAHRSPEIGPAAFQARVRACAPARARARRRRSGVRRRSAPLLPRARTPRRRP